VPKRSHSYEASPPSNRRLGTQKTGQPPVAEECFTNSSSRILKLKTAINIWLNQINADAVEWPIDPQALRKRYASITNYVP